MPTTQVSASGDPFLAIAAAAAGDTVLLPRGMDKTRSTGKPPLAPRAGVTIGEYGERNADGSPKLPRPILRFPGDAQAFVVKGVSNVTLKSVQVLALGGGKQYSYGVEIDDAEDVLLENMVLAGWRMNVNADGSERLTIRGTLLEKSRTADAGQFGHSQGLYAYNVDGLVIDRSAFVRNGVNERGGRSKYDHGAYIAATCNGLVVTGTAFVENSSHGLQARCGGDIRDGLFVNNPIGMSYGVVNDSEVKTGGVKGTVERLVFLGGNPIDGEKRGYAAEFGNAREVIVRDILAAHDTQRHDAPFVVNPCRNPKSGTVPVNPSRINFARCFAHDWQGHPDRPQVLRVAEGVDLVGTRERVERLAPSGIDVWGLLNGAAGIESAARRDPWTCAGPAVAKSRAAFKLDAPPPPPVEDAATLAKRARLAAIEAELVDIAATLTAATEARARLVAERAVLLGQLPN